MNDHNHLVWPAERFYWAIVDGPARARLGPVPLGLLAEAGEDFPDELDALHAVGAPTSDGRLIVCAVETERLGTLHSDASSLTPSGLPCGIDADATKLEVLVGRFEPACVRRRKLRKHCELALVVLMCSMLVTIGMLRRSNHAERTALGYADARHAILETTNIQPGTLDRLILLRQAFAHARSLSPQPRDAGDTLQSLLLTWPNTTDAFVDSITIAHESIMSSITFPSDPGAFLASLEPPSGWKFEEPRLSSSRGSTRVSLTIRPGGAVAP